MKKLSTLFYGGALVLALALTGCSHFIAPPYTNVERLAKLKPGASLAEVNTLLGIEPYDVYFLEEDGSMVVTYNYRVKDRNLTVNGTARRREIFIRSEAAQKDGDAWYKKESNVVYVFFKEGKFKAMLTDAGRADGEFLIFANNNIEFIKSTNLNQYEGKDVKVIPLTPDQSNGSFIENFKK